MGKKNKKNKDFVDTRTAAQKEFDIMVADSILSFIDDVDRLCILEGTPVDDIENSMKYIKKKMKQLKRGEREKVYNKDMIDELDEEYNLNG